MCESEVAQSCQTLSVPWTAAYQVPPSMRFSMQEYWSGVPLPSPYEELEIQKIIILYFICLANKILYFICLANVYQIATMWRSLV